MGCQAWDIQASSVSESQLGCIVAGLMQGEELSYMQKGDFSL